MSTTPTSHCFASGAQRTLTTLAVKWRAEVWGSPIRHSLSPALHNAAYKELGSDASYSFRDVTSETLEAELLGLPSDYRGLSLTMPLKETVLGLVGDHRGLVEELGAANTVVAGPAGWALWNTDPAGVTGALQEASLGGIARAVVLGAGATARSVLCALAGQGVSAITIYSRDRERSRTTLEYARSKGCDVEWAGVADVVNADPAELVVSTLPHGVSVASSIPDGLVRESALLDVTYDPWPSELAMRWQSSPHPVLSGATMLLHQAVAQIRIFTNGDPETPLPHEAAVVRAMRDALPGVVIDASGVGE